MDYTVLPPKLLSRLSAAADLVRSHDFIQVFSHHDADGISSAGILANMLARENKEFQVTIFPMLTEETFQKIKDCDAKCVIVSDMGASYIERLEELEGKDIIVLDHHTVMADSDKFVYVNPLLYDPELMNSGCGATMCFLFSISMNDNNWDLVQLAFAGIIGDKQTLDGIHGLNKYILGKAKEKGFVTEIEGTIIPQGVLSQSLFYCTEPYIRGVTGKLDGVKKVLSDAGIPMGKRSEELTDEERRKLSSLLVTRMAGTNVTVATMKECMLTHYYLNGWKMDAQMLGDLLNSCGRTENPSVGIAMALGSRDDLMRANELKKQLDDNLIQSVLDLDEKKPTRMDNIQYFFANEFGATGALCSIAMKCIGDPDKPTIGLRQKEGRTDASARGTFRQLERGIDLAKAMGEAARSVGGEGGGHRIASGATMSPGKEEDFLKKLNEVVGRQIGAM